MLENKYLGKIRLVIYRLYKFFYRFPKRFRRKFWETNEDNKYYGHYDIFIHYTGVFLPYKINGEVQHGWSPHSGLIDPNTPIQDVKERKYYLINESNQKKSIGKGFYNTEIIGSPFLYFLDLIKISNKEVSKSLLLFPLHSHEWVKFSDPVMTHKTYLKEIIKIRHLFKTISVSLGWKEYQNKNVVKLFTREKIKVVTMGHRDNNQKFLFNFYDQVSKHEYIASDTFCTALFYGLIMNKKCFVYGKQLNENSVFKKNKDFLDNLWIGPEKSYHEFYSKKYPILLWDNFDHKPHPYIAEEELGMNYKKKPKELRKIFEWNLSCFFKSFIDPSN